MLVATLGPSVASHVGLHEVFADEGKKSLSFGKLEPLVALIEETEPDRLLPMLVKHLKSGTGLKELVAAGALASSRCKATSDYNGLHAFLALAPSYAMSQQSPKQRQSLPVLKVVLNNAYCIHDLRVHGKARLQPVVPAVLPNSKAGGKLMREATRQEEADGILAALLTQRSSRDVYDEILLDSFAKRIDVHAIVSVWRAWDLLDLTGEAHALTMFRQAKAAGSDPDPEFGPLLLRMFEEHRLDRPSAGRAAGDKSIERLSRTIFESGRKQAVGEVASALGEGIDLQAIGEAISLAASLVMLHDPGEDGNAVHGGHAGVHASDAANAWRNIARVSNHRNAIASLLAATWYVAGARDGGVRAGGRYMTNGGLKYPYPQSEHTAKIASNDATTLLREADGAIRENDQGRACAAVQKYGELGHKPQPVIDLLLKYATSEEGDNHAEKYYRTATQEFATTRAPYRWRHLVALARVTASEYGWVGGKRGQDPSYEQACDLLGLPRS
jgi:hypothetical protein